ncbi:hypothetical protein, partial [Nocardia brasiliensis]|uniref:hypothetical protein n=1 Tax=Nocardia brasiliensis TaxID=37326 RepID=UPI0024586DBA
MHANVVTFRRPSHPGWHMTLPGQFRARLRDILDVGVAGKGEFVVVHVVDGGQHRLDRNTLRDLPL